MKIISFFNHKGGVAKTTTVFHLGWKLAQMGKKVLLVDTDSQCNLTFLALGDAGYQALLQNQPTNNIKSSLDPVFSAAPAPLVAPQCVQVPNIPNLYILPGSFEISEFDVQLSIAIQMTPAFRTTNNLPGSLWHLFNACATNLKADYVLVDFNPSKSALNQVLLACSDYFIVPTAPDFFSQYAVQSMATFLPQWENYAKGMRAYFANSAYPLPNIQPKFLGYTINDYNIRNGQPTQAYNQIIQQTDTLIENTFYPAISAEQMDIPQNQYLHGFCLASLSNFQHLLPQYQKYRVPVFALTNAQIRTFGIILKNHKIKRALFDSIYTDFANNVIRLAI